MEKELVMIKPVRLSELAERYGLELAGEDIEICTMGSLIHRSSHENKKLTYVSSKTYFEEFMDKDIACAVIPKGLFSREDEMPGEKGFLLTGEKAEEVFFSIFYDSVEEGCWEVLTPGRGKDNCISDNAVVHENVEIGNGCTIMDNVVLLPNTRLGDGVVIKPNSVIGGNGFHVKSVHGRKRVIPHTGGVWIGDNVEIGSCCCIDKGLFGDFTEVGRDTKIDNLVHLAHSVVIGESCLIAACAELSGSITIGDGVWSGPGTTAVHGISIGNNSYIAISSMLGRSVPANAFVSPVPSRRTDWVCNCRTKLDFTDGIAYCSSCGKGYRLEDGCLRELKV